MRYLLGAQQKPFPLSDCFGKRSTCRDVQHRGAIGIELKRRLTVKGLRQAEVEFYLWRKDSYYPFMQIITDMRSGGFAYYARPKNASDGDFSAHTFLTTSNLAEVVDFRWLSQEFSVRYGQRLSMSNWQKFYQIWRAFPQYFWELKQSGVRFKPGRQSCVYA